jgi:hypothetical protein
MLQAERHHKSGNKAETGFDMWLISCSYWNAEAEPLEKTCFALKITTAETEN